MAGPLVHLIDAHVWIFRAYHSLPEMYAPDGSPTWAAYGFANTLLRYIAEREPTHIACCFDHDLTSFRNEIFPAYKASRLVPPADLEPQFEMAVRASRALGVPAFEVPDYEADDVAATLCGQLLGRGARVVVVTPDKDLAQLVREDGRIVLHDFVRERTMDAAGVVKRFGVTPEQIPDFLALVGDSVDELPGVAGVGPKSAAAALQAFGSLDAMPADPDAWAGLPVRGARRLGERIAAHREQAAEVRELATVVRAVPGLGVKLGELRWRGAIRGEVETLFGELGWGRIATRIPRWAGEG